MEPLNYSAVFSTMFLVIVISIIWKALMVLIWRPYSIMKHFGKQGVKGPAYNFLSGSVREMVKIMEEEKQKPMNPLSHDVTPKVLPHYYRWSQQYGETFLFWFGTQPQLSIMDPEMIKEVFSTKFGYFNPEEPTPAIHALLGNGLLTITGTDWVKHRRTLNPAFTIDKLKGMTTRMVACTVSALGQWDDHVTKSKSDCVEVEMHKAFTELTADIIAHTSFGTSFMEGKEVFEIERELHQMVIASITDVHIPGKQYIPTKWNRHMWKLEKQLRNKLKLIIEQKLSTYEDSNSNDSKDDLLGLMIGISKDAKKEKGLILSVDEIIDECKTFFFAGHETTSNLLTWAMFLLGSSQDWQDRLREEVESVCGTHTPNAETVSKLKFMNMVLYETLRLYSPLILSQRKASQDIKIGNLLIPKGTLLTFPFPMIHRDKKYWGGDADEFNPMRFSDGMARAAKHPNAFMAFSMGPRVCIGQNFAMLEAKIVLSMILKRFSFTISPNYKHSPANNVLLQPQFGVPINFKPLK